jgi:DNA-binding IclR family transcriptional regulator
MDIQLSPLKSADRVLDVLELLARRGRGLSHAELAASLNIPKSSLTYLLRNLLARRYLAQEPSDKTFRLGEATFALGRNSQRFRVVDIAGPFIDRLASEARESSALNVLRDDEVERVYGANASMDLLYDMRVGAKFPLYSTSAGKAILAFLPRNEREAYLARTTFQKITPHTLSATALRKELQQVSKEGVAYSREESTLGIVGLAVPVLNTNQAPIASINIALPTVRFTSEQDTILRSRLRATRQALEAELAKS